jgi:hypothetical protein
MKDRRQKGPEKIRAILRPITILVKATACGVHHSACTAVYAAKAAAVAVASMAKTAINNIQKAMKVVRKVPECPGNPARASLVAS